MKKILTLSTLILFSVTFVKAQSYVNSIANEPKVIEAIAPEYPEKASSINAEERVIVKLTINEKGIVSNAALVDGNKLFVKNSLAAAKRWRFEEDKNHKKRIAVIAFTYRLIDKKEGAGVLFYPPYQIEIAKEGLPKVKEIPASYSSNEILPKVIKSVPPVYQQIAAAARVTGEVEVEVRIDKEGKVVSAKATKGHPLLKASAVSVAYRWEFDKSGEEYRTVNLTFVFQLPDKIEDSKISFKSPYKIEVVYKYPELIFLRVMKQRRISV